MHRAPLRLNLLLEATAAWGRSASFEELLPELPRLKWILEFDRCILLLNARASAAPRAFVITPAAARETGTEALSLEERDVLQRAVDESQPQLGDRVLGYPLESGACVIGAACFSAAAPYTHDDLRFAQFIAQALAGIIDRLVAREEERRIGASEARYRSLVSVLTDVPWVTDPDGAFVTPQPAWEAYTGQSWNELRGFGWADVLHPDDRAEVQAAWRKACQSRTPYEAHGRLWHARSRQFRHFVARAVPLVDDDGRVREWVGTCTDVHDRRHAEEQLRESEQRLREADRRKDEFIATLAHELRNPLAPIRTGLQLIRLAGDTPGAVERVRSVMERQVGHMVRLIDDLLDVSRITSGRLELQRRATTLADVMHGAIDATRAFIDAAGLRLTVDWPDEPCVFDADPTRLVQILSNLLHNAAKFTPAGGRIHLRAALVDRDDAVRRGLILSVADTGIGIAPDVLPRVFGLFMQGGPPPHQVQGGLGIGLALTRQLVELHGGRIEARSDGEGKGSEFLVSLPLRPVTVPEVAPAEEATDDDPARGHRVVIIDDNEDAATTLAMLVDELGGEARTAGDGLSGIQCVLDSRPDIVFVDIGMPGIDGYETCRRIRRALPTPPLFMVALTGWGQERDRQAALDAGFDAHLTKPADVAVLTRLLTQAGPTNARAS